jgi:transcriptional regulator
MYIPDLYRNENKEEIQEFIHQNGFAILINTTNGKLWASHIPLVLENSAKGNQILEGHLSIENPQAQNLQDNQEILAVFSGPHSYISSSWYDHENVPTWNYIAIHVYGKVKLLNYDQTIESLKKLVNKYEASSEKPVRIEALSAKTMRQAKGIIAFNIEITSIEAKKKLSQNRDEKNYDSIIFNLENSTDPMANEIAKAMKKNKK